MGGGFAYKELQPNYLLALVKKGSSCVFLIVKNLVNKVAPKMLRKTRKISTLFLIQLNCYLVRSTLSPPQFGLYRVRQKILTSVDGR